MRGAEIRVRPLREMIRHPMLGGRHASESACQVYSTLEKTLSAMRTHVPGFVHNGNMVFDANGLCMVGRVSAGATWLYVKKLWLNPEDHA